LPHFLGSFAYIWPFYAAPVVGYLLGSIPFGLLLTRLAGLGDIRRVGSGNIGATNVLRTGNKALAAIVLLLDGGKGAAAVLLLGTMGPDMAALGGLGAVVGHVFPVWLGFKGGKGVATGLGVLVAAAWPVGLAACATWVAVAALSRYASLASLLAFLLAPLYAQLLAHDGEHVLLAALIAILVWLRHIANIRRLAIRQEPRIGAKSKAAEPS
jgi:glycerol-3-phosphate acyltransferase PlsY